MGFPVDHYVSKWREFILLGAPRYQVGHMGKNMLSKETGLGFEFRNVGGQTQLKFLFSCQSMKNGYICYMMMKKPLFVINEVH
jgi:hypothetical protein